ncbi:unnamed protein product [Candida verbasci]|uniref:Uncharacterized protein n=1 Tax=Candida verbasci TaxID=1227364 RepID=A0A9W4TY13_9ASCO|nr:unnamed protein product [Candida verbasci]
MKFLLLLSLIALVSALPPPSESIDKRAESFVCPSGATKCQTRFKKASLDIEVKDQYSLGKIYGDDGKELPVYIVNIDGQSPGNACNAQKFIVNNYNNDNYFNKDGYIVLARGSGYDRDQVLRGYSCSSSSYQRDEFPPNSANSIMEKVTDISVLCITASDNEIDGCNLSRFFTGTAAKKATGSSQCVTNDNTHYHPNQASSTPRNFQIEQGEKFAVVINTKNSNGCKAYT